ncbi:MAG: glycosyltransferase family 39 protein [Lachnospiraceae bacterium]|nr:glycosyltransferase family 39 protein [Lachnospiraceae bacterium]
MSRREYGVVILAIFSAAALLSFLLRKRRDGILVFTALCAFILRLVYIIYTPTDIRQHDVIGFGGTRGQAAYIEWFYNNGLKLIQTDPRDKWGFFQPPLHHVLAAGWLKLNTLMGVPYARATENIQYLTLIYSLILLFYAYRLFKYFKLSGKALYAAFALVAFHPSFILLSGSVNNDMLCILLTVMTVYYALKWYDSRSYADIIKTALCMGLSMMTKLSGVLSAPAVAFLFLYVWIKGGRSDFLKYLKEYLIFGLISVPIGMWFPIRSYLKFGIPLNYTPVVGERLIYNSPLSRIIDIRTYKPYVSMIKYGDPYDEYNIPLSLMKTSLTGEFDYTSVNRYITPFAWILLAAGTVLALICLAATVRMVLKKIPGRDRIPDIYIGIIYVTALAFYLNLAFGIPNFSSQDFRYICYIIVIEALSFGSVLIYNEPSGEAKTGGLPANLILAVTGGFCAAGAAVYLLLGLP